MHAVLIGKLHQLPTNPALYAVPWCYSRCEFLQFLPESEAQRFIPLGPLWGATTPDFFYTDPGGRLEGVCIRLDGMSDGLHGNPDQPDARSAQRTALMDSFSVTW